MMWKHLDGSYYITLCKYGFAIQITSRRNNIRFQLYLRKSPRNFVKGFIKITKEAYNTVQKWNFQESMDVWRFFFLLSVKWKSSFCFSNIYSTYFLTAFLTRRELYFKIELMSFSDLRSFKFNCEKNPKNYRK